MLVARFELPDGRVARFEVPDGTSPEQAKLMIDTQIKENPVKYGMPSGSPDPWAELEAMVPQPDRSQTNWEAMRPYVAPVMEGLGAAGGAAAGTFVSGPAGGALMGGVGYAGAKQIVNVIDQYNGATPRYESPLRNTAEGAAMEIVGPYIVKGGARLAGGVSNLVNASKLKAANIARNTLGESLPTVRNALVGAGKGITPGQATVDMYLPEWQALNKNIGDVTPRPGRLLEQQELESVGNLNTLAGGRTATETRGSVEKLAKGVSAKTTPMREGAFEWANAGEDILRWEKAAAENGTAAKASVQKVKDMVNAGQVAEARSYLKEEARNLAKQKAQNLVERGFVDKDSYLVKEFTGEEAGHLSQLERLSQLEKYADELATSAANGSLDFGLASRFAETAAERLKAMGLKPLESAPIIARMKSVLKDPNFAENKPLYAATEAVIDGVNKWTKNNGVIDAAALDAIRKNTVNRILEALPANTDATTQQKTVNMVLSKLKPMIDEAMGPAYKKYLDQHAAGMAKAAEKKLAGEALRLWKTDKQGFINLIRGESPDVVEKFLGPGNYNIGQELSDHAMITLEKEAGTASRNLRVDELATRGQDALKRIIEQNKVKFRLPPSINLSTRVGNKVLSEIEQKLGSKVTDALIKGFENPKAAADLLGFLPAAERNAVLKLLSNPSTWSALGKATTTGTTAGVYNALAPDSAVKNGLLK